MNHAFLTTSPVGQLPGVGCWLPQSLLGRAPDGQVFSSSLPCLLRRTGTVPVLLCLLSSHTGLCTENSEDNKGLQGSARLVHLEWGSPAPRHMCLRSWVNSPWPPTPDYIYDLLFAASFLVFPATLIVGCCMSLWVAALYTLHTSLSHSVKQEPIGRGRACKQELCRRLQHPWAS